jgi:membrane protease YdiL (CAAX protease family)
MNITLLARDLLAGRATVSGFALTLASTLLFSALALVLAARIYDSERLVAPSPKQRTTVAPGAHSTSAGDALVLFALGFLLLYFVFLPIEQHHLKAGLLISEWGGLLGMVALYAHLSGQRFGSVVALARVPARSAIGAALVGLGAWAAVAIVSEWLLPVPASMLEQLRRSLVPTDGLRGLPATLFVVALSPAVCEEALFRGPILRGLRTRLGPTGAVLITGALFGLFHLDLYRLIPTTALGILLGMLALKSGSIVPAVIAHFCNNAVLVTLATLNIDQHLEHLSYRTTTLLVAASVGLTAIGLALVRGPQNSPETGFRRGDEM